MNKLKLICATALCGMTLLGAPMLKAADVSTYQVTGPVLELTASTIVVQKGQARWELARDPSMKITGDLKVGSKVTITYKMVAQVVEVKEAKPKKQAAK